MVQKFAESQQVHRHRRQLRAHLVIQRGKLRNHKDEHEKHQAANQRHQHAGINQRRHQLLAKGERGALEAHIALQHLLQIAAALAGQQRSGVHHRKAALRLKSRRKCVAGLHPRGHVVQLRRKIRVLLVLGQHLNRAQNRQPGANQHEELLVENEKRLQFDLALREPPKSAPGFDGKDVVAGVNKAGAQLLGGGRGLHLLLHAAALVGQFDYEFRHASARRVSLESAPFQIRTSPISESRPHPDRSLTRCPLFPANFPSIQGTSSRPLCS